MYPSLFSSIGAYIKVTSSLYLEPTREYCVFYVRFAMYVNGKGRCNLNDNCLDMLARERET